MPNGLNQRVSIRINGKAGLTRGFLKSHFVTIITIMDTPCPDPFVRRARGLTLIELLVTLAIAAILSTLAAPSLKEFIVRSRMNNVTSEFSGAVLKARNEAVNRNVCASMCLSTTAMSDEPSCADSGTDWQTGWIVFLNPTCDSAKIDPSLSDVIVARGSTDERIHLENSDAAYLHFNARGNPKLSATRIFKLTYGTGEDDAMTQRFGLNVCLDSMGRTRTIPRDKACAAYN
ncbi:GspH/FimT family pseudopilin [Diaphorobacter caeni]|uniref:GspH/FimT family pseudopilin n=1 Tax=Diaphorobacter caeni TaxID=2784387 RepID=UPI00188F4001|nr:GspH/FimT family pseudopilin [Diaphorobacter caeni]MBF5003344.1 GspH/FimT family pseudopilin [Diaphorobacter caeni]